MEFDHDRREKRLARLRKLIIHSADANPGDVAAYLDQVAKQPHAWKQKEQILKAIGGRKTTRRGMGIHPIHV